MLNHLKIFLTTLFNKAELDNNSECLAYTANFAPIHKDLPFEETIQLFIDQKYYILAMHGTISKTF
jgi:hypothetical protein